MIIEAHGVVVAGQRMASMWMAKDNNLFADALKVVVRPGTINIRFEADAHERLHTQLLLGSECVDPGYIRGNRRLVVRECSFNGASAFIVRHQIHPDKSCVVEIIAPTIPGVYVEALGTLTFEGDGLPRMIVVPSR